MNIDSNKNKLSNSSTEERVRGIKLLIIILVLIFILTFWLGWQYWKDKQLFAFQIENSALVDIKKDSIINELINLQSQYSSLKTGDILLQTSLNQKRDTITLLLQQVNKYKNDPYIIAHLRKEAQILEQSILIFKTTIDSLNKQNQNLTSEKSQVVESLKTEKNISNMLKMQNSKIVNQLKAGSLLEATSVNTRGIFYNSGNIEKTTEKAKKIEKIEVQFTIKANPITKSGSKNIYIRVITPDARELPFSNDASSVFNFEGVKGYFDAEQTINYTNQQINLIMYCGSNAGFIPGKYYVKIYSDQAQIGEASLTLH